eukprot:g29108.t1
MADQEDEPPPPPPDSSASARGEPAQLKSPEDADDPYASSAPPPRLSRKPSHPNLPKKKKKKATDSGGKAPKVEYSGCQTLKVKDLKAKKVFVTLELVPVGEESTKRGPPASKPKQGVHGRQPVTIL